MMDTTSDNVALNPQRFVFVMIGFTEAERSMLASTFRLTSRRSICYVEPSDAPGSTMLRPDIYLIDADQPEALKSVQLADAKRSGPVACNTAPNLHAPAVVIGREEVDIGWPFVKKPIHWTRLFEQLDAVMRTALRERLQRRVLEKQGQSTDAVWDGRTMRRQVDLLTLHALETPVHITHPRETVLVVDDSATVRAFMRIKLAPFQFDVDYAENGEQAVAMALAKSYTCIFLDIMMPGIDGYEVCKQIKGHQATKKTAVVMLTSKSSMLDKFRAAWSGCDAYLGKPVVEDDLLATIAKFLPGAQAAQSTQGKNQISSNAG